MSIISTIQRNSKIALIGIFAGLTFASCKTKQKEVKEEVVVAETPKNWSEKLGFPAGKKVIILHADDIGLSEEANIAVKPQLLNGHIQSAAIMMTCPNAEEFVQWAIDHPKMDIGLHLTLTSEWVDYRWGPVENPKIVPSIIDPDGKLWPEIPDLVAHASAEDVEKEIRAQIEKSIALGYRPDHIDTHMGTLFGNPGYTKAYLKVAEEYGIPAMVIDFSKPQVLAASRALAKVKGYVFSDAVVEMVENYSLPKLDFFTEAPQADTYDEKIENFKQLIKSLPAGLIEIIFHPAIETEQLKGITNAWQQRVWEAKMFSDPDLIKFFEDEDIIFTNWKEIMKRFKK